MAVNPRYANGHRRREITAWVKATYSHCAICGQAIDWNLKWYTDPTDGKRKLHPMSGEVDEIIPVSLGGSPVDKRNVQGAHRICNQRKGNKMYSEPKEAQIVKHSRKW